ncbi:MAG: redox-regulated ATPase YchF [Lentisphaerae bacterium]|nr:redox-regulated ATPase YchF [Lentisphaerota bacterium]
MRVALLGLSQSGKKTFFTLLTARDARQGAGLPALKPGETLEGIAPIHDGRVDTLAALCKPEATKYAENHIVLCPDVVPGDAKREWLEAARRCDLLCLVVRAFTAAEVYHPAGSVDHGRDRQTLEVELLLADLELIEKRLERLSKEKRADQAPQLAQEEQTLTKLKAVIETGMKLAPPTLQPHEMESIRSLNLLIIKPVIWVFNVDEDRLSAKLGRESETVFMVSCRIEQEIMDLPPADREAYLKDLGLTASGVDRLNQAAYDALGLRSFFTIGQDEVRAWTIRKGSTAPTAAGKVHSDIERGFIRVEIIKFDDMVAAGSEAQAKAHGKMQVKGRDYVIEDGDICHFRFNV